MPPSTHSTFVQFLRDELLIPDASIAIAQKHSEQNQGPMPMVLWQYGLVTLEQLNQIYEWLETA